MSDFGDQMVRFAKKAMEEQAEHRNPDRPAAGKPEKPADSNILEFTGGKKQPQENAIPKGSVEVLINPQMLKVVGVKKRIFDSRKYQDVLLDGFDRALEMTKEESYPHEMPLDESAELVDNILQKLFSDEVSGDHVKNAALLLQAEKDKSVDPKELSQAASYFTTLKFKISQAKSSLIDQMMENYRQTRIDIRGRSKESKQKVKEDVANVEKQIHDIVDIKSDEIIAKSLGLKSLEDLDRAMAMAEQVQNIEGEQALKVMSQ